MARKMDQKSRETWRKLLAQKQRSGLTVVEFCQREGVSTAAYYTWRRKLHGQRSRRTPQAAVVRRKDAPMLPKGKAPGSRPSGAFVQVPLPAASASAWIEVVLAEGRSSVFHNRTWQHYKPSYVRLVAALTRQ